MSAILAGNAAVIVLQSTNATVSVLLPPPPFLLFSFLYDAKKSKTPETQSVLSVWLPLVEWRCED